jgi:hypothetical protein
MKLLIVNAQKYFSGMSSQRNWSNDFRDVRTTLTRELWTSPDRSAQFQARVGVFGGSLVRIGISRYWWNEDEKRFLPSQRGHCYFPPQVLEHLAQAIPDLQAEAKHLEKSQAVNANGMLVVHLS